MKIITLGTFDILHVGHINLLKKCWEIGNEVIVGLNTDGFIKKYKGKPPVMTYKEREEALLSTNLVSRVIPNNQESGNARKIIKDSGAKIIVIGSDWARKEYISQIGVNWDWLDRQRIGICYVTYTHGISTTEIKRRILEN